MSSGVLLALITTQPLAEFDSIKERGSNLYHLNTTLPIICSVWTAKSKVSLGSLIKVSELAVSRFMSLSIKVNHIRKTRVFHAGDQISGTVVATGPIKEAATVIEIKFKGKSQTEVERGSGESSTLYRDQVKFFKVVKVLFSGACKIEKGSSTSWPFAFQLPLHTEPEEGNPDIVYSRNLTSPYAKGPHFLPPTISVSGYHTGSRYRAIISYELYAQLQRSAIFSRSLRRSGNLPVTLCRPQADGDPPDPQMTAHHQDFTHATSHLLPDHATQSRSLHEWLSDTFTSKAPSVSFSLSARSPTTLVEGQAIPIELCLVLDSAKSTAPLPPEFRLISADYKFKEYTNVRAQWTRKQDATVEPSNVVFSKKMLFETATTATPLKSDEIIDVGAIHNVSLPELQLIPPFNSYNICRSYGAKLTVKITCAGKQFVAKFEWKPVILLPQEVAIPGCRDGDTMKELSRASGMRVFGFGDAMDLGAGSAEAIVDGLGVLEFD